MARIEQLVKMVDRPGRPREFRFRRLKHTEAQLIAEKVLSLAEELQDIPVTVAATPTAEASLATLTPEPETPPRPRHRYRPVRERFIWIRTRGPIVS